MKSVLDRFIKYAKINTESAYSRDVVPSTEQQRDLASVLADELAGVGATDIFISDTCCVYGRIPSNCKELKAPSIGFCAHIDTTPEFSGKNVNPRIVSEYDGGDIVLNEKENIVMSPAKFPHLKRYIGQDLIVTNGMTLLGADDKAGIAEIMTMAYYFHDNPTELHGELQFFFPSDEEIGCLGAATFDKDKFNPDFAYTLDGGPLGEITYECFNAASAYVTINGVNIHPGLSKNQMKNSILIAHEFLNMLPAAETPSHTENYEGYYHVIDFSGSVDLTKMRFYLRDHDKEKFAQRKARIEDTAAYLNKVYGEGTVGVVITDTYGNMSEMILPHFEIVEAIESAMKKLGVTPFYTPMRGGTDGAQLSFMGVPCPNICTGGHNFHSRNEYVPVQSLEKISEILVEIVKSFVK